MASSQRRGDRLHRQTERHGRLRRHGRLAAPLQRSRELLDLRFELGDMLARIRMLVEIHRGRQLCLEFRASGRSTVLHPGPPRSRGGRRAEAASAAPASVLVRCGEAQPGTDRIENQHVGHVDDVVHEACGRTSWWRGRRPRCGSAGAAARGRPARWRHDAGSRRAARASAARVAPSNAALTAAASRSGWKLSASCAAARPTTREPSRCSLRTTARGGVSSPRRL